MSFVTKLYKDKRFATLLCLGFVSGLPFLLTLSTLSFWLSEVGISKTNISFLMLAGIPYSIKFLWAPFLDQVRLPFLTSFLGHRRAWAIFAHLGLMAALLCLGWTDPKNNLSLTFLAALAVSLFAATLDTVIDAYRIELLPDRHRAMGASVEAIGFRIGMLTSGAGALYIAAALSWQWAYTIMAGCMFLGIIAILKTPLTQTLPHLVIKPSRITFKAPFQSLFQQKYFFHILLFIFCFKCIDTVLSAMSAPFFFELGVSKVEFADISKVFGVILMVLGALSGGILLKFLGDLEGVILAFSLQIASALMFTLQAIIGYDITALIITVGVESFTSGLTSAVFIAYLSKFCMQPHTATHFTILYSFGSLCRVLTSSGAAYIADHISWTYIFFMSCIVAVPGFYYVIKLERKTAPLKHRKEQEVA